MTRSRSQVETLLSQLQAAGASYADGAPGSREKLLSLCHGLQSSLESPSEAIMRIGWAEVSYELKAKLAEILHSSLPPPIC